MKVDGRVLHFAVAPTVGQSRGIAVVLHGGGNTETGRGFAARHDITDKLNREGWTAVLPDALDGRFHAGRCCTARTFSKPSARSTDDLRFIGAAVRDTRRRYRVLRGPVVAIGFSNGGFMAYRLACQTSLLSSMVVVAALDVTRRPCRPKRPVAALLIHSRHDPRVPFSGGRFLGGETLSVFQLARRWARIGTCASRFKRTPAAGYASYFSGRCRARVDVQVDVLDSDKHFYPSATPGSSVPTYDATERALKFIG